MEFELSHSTKAPEKNTNSTQSPLVITFSKRDVNSEVNATQDKKKLAEKIVWKNKILTTQMANGLFKSIST